MACNGQWAGCNCNGQSSNTCIPQTGSGGGCYPQTTGTISPRPQYVWTNIAVGQKFRKVVLDELKSAISSEFGTRSMTAPYWTPRNVGNKIGSLIEIRDKLNELRNYDVSRGTANSYFSFNATYAPGTKVTLAGILSLRVNANSLQATCVCNCAYNCTCNCAYNCTCNCAYCNCNCAYYACTCDCAYG